MQKQETVSRITEAKKNNSPQSSGQRGGVWVSKTDRDVLLSESQVMKRKSIGLSLETPKPQSPALTAQIDKLGTSV